MPCGLSIKIHLCSKADRIAREMIRKLVFSFVIIVLLKGFRSLEVITAYSEKVNEPNHTEHAKMARYIVHKVGKSRCTRILKCDELPLV